MASSLLTVVGQENTEWSQKTLATLKKMSPTSLKVRESACGRAIHLDTIAVVILQVVHRQLLNGKKKDLAACFRMEEKMAEVCSEFQL